MHRGKVTTTDAVQAGGVLAFASLVLYILKELRPVLKEIASQLFEMRITFAALLERERVRDMRRKRESSGPQPVPVAVDPDDETTDMICLIDKHRKAATKGKPGV